MLPVNNQGRKSIGLQRIRQHFVFPANTSLAKCLRPCGCLEQLILEMATLKAWWSVNACGRPPGPHTWLHTDFYHAGMEVQTPKYLLSTGTGGPRRHCPISCLCHCGNIVTLFFLISYKFYCSTAWMRSIYCFRKKSNSAQNKSGFVNYERQTRSEG